MFKTFNMNKPLMFRLKLLKINLKYPARFSMLCKNENARDK